MPTQLSKGKTFIDGGNYDANDLNTLVDSATILPGAISEQPQVAPITGDQFLFVKTSQSALKRCTLGMLVAAFPSGAAPGTFSLRKLGSGSTMAAPGDDSRFPSAITGIRKGNGTGSDTAAEAQDFIFYHTITGTLIDWDEGNVFYKSITGDTSFSFAAGGLRNGRQITVAIRLNGHTASFPSHPQLGTLQSLGSGTAVNIYTWTVVANQTVGWVVKV